MINFYLLKRSLEDGGEQQNSIQITMLFFRSFVERDCRHYSVAFSNNRFDNCAQYASKTSLNFDLIFNIKIYWFQ